MRKIIKIFCIAVFTIQLFSCEDQVNTSAEFRERNVLSGIINCDTSMQIIYLMKTYESDEIGVNPSLEKIFIHDADIKVWYDYNVYQFRDTSILSSNNDTISFYYNSELIPEQNKSMDIEALLPNNILLRSLTFTPNTSQIRFIEADKFLPPSSNSSTLKYFWTGQKNYIYDARLFINYLLANDTGSVSMSIPVPVEYVFVNNTEQPVFANPTNQPSLSIKWEAFGKTMEKISNEIEIKSRIVILNAVLEVMIYDENLSAYYSSIQQYLDQFSISLDQPEYTNIDGGLGVFGSYITKSLDLQIEKEYIQSFGYRTGQ